MKITQKMVNNFYHNGGINEEWAIEYICDANSFLRKGIKNKVYTGYTTRTKKDYIRSLWIISNKILNGSKEYTVNNL